MINMLARLAFAFAVLLAFSWYGVWGLVIWLDTKPDPYFVVDPPPWLYRIWKWQSRWYPALYGLAGIVLSPWLACVLWRFIVASWRWVIWG